MAGEKNLTVVVTASLAQMREELKKADSIIQSTSSALSRMGNSYSGASTIAQANAAMRAVQEAGGVTRLTEAEQRKLNAALTEGVAKYQALGKQAPAEMVALRDATNKAIPATNELGTSAGSLTDKLKGAAGALGLAFGASAVIGGIKSLVTNTLAYASTIDDTSKKLGISVDATQRYKFAAEQTGASLENVSKSVLKLSQNLAGGDKGVKEALAAAGLSFASIRAMKPEEAFDATAAAIAKIPDPMTQARVAMELFGKGGAELLPAIREGFTDIAKGVKTMSDETIARLAKAEDAWAAFANSVVIWSGEILGGWLAAVDTIGTLTNAQASAYQAIVKSGGDGAAFLKNIAEENTAASKAALVQMNQYATAADHATAAVASLLNGKKELTAEEIAAAAASRRSADAFQEQVDVLTGKALAREVEALAAQIRATGKDGGVSAHQMELLGKKLSEMRAQGANLPAFMDAMANGFEDAHRKGLPLVTTLQSIAIAMRAVQGQKMGAAPESFSATPILTSIKQAMGAVPKIMIGDMPKIVEPIKTALGQAFSGLGQTIIGAIQGGGNVGKAIGASLLGGLGEDLGAKLATKIGGSLGKALGGFAGPLGALLGGQIGGLVDKIIGSNDTKKDREAAARMMGYSSISAMNDALNKLGAEGQALVHQGLNVIGKKDTAANNAWIASVKALFAKQAEVATQATEKAAADQAAALAKITDPLKAKLKDIDAEYQKLSDSIAKEAPEEIMGVIEAQERAALADLAVQREVVENELKAAETKVLDTASAIRVGIEKLFKDPIRVMFDLSNFPQTGGGGGAYGGAMAEGGSGIVNRPTWFLAGEAGPERYNFTPMGSGGSGGGGGDQTIVVQIGDEAIIRKVVRGMPKYLKLIGAQ